MRLPRWRTHELAALLSLLFVGSLANDSTLFECPKGRYRFSEDDFSHIYLLPVLFVPQRLLWRIQESSIKLEPDSLLLLCLLPGHLHKPINQRLKHPFNLIQIIRAVRCISYPSHLLFRHRKVVHWMIGRWTFNLNDEETYALTWETLLAWCNRKSPTKAASHNCNYSFKDLSRNYPALP